MRGLVPAAFLVFITRATVPDDDVDDCALLAVRQTLGKRASIASHENAANKAHAAMQRVFASFSNDPVSSFQWLDKVLGLQKAVLDNHDSQKAREQLALLSNEVRTRACAGDLGPCWRQSDAHLVDMPKYPHEPLLDDDFIHNAGNWLDKWMDEKHTAVSATATTTGPPNPQTNASFVGACFIRSEQPIGNAKPGTKCLFGIVAEDEGSHCIYDNGKYGSFGWCFTNDQKKEWGSCAETCPTAGNAKVLVAKINMLQNQIVKLLLKLREKNSKV